LAFCGRSTARQTAQAGRLARRCSGRAGVDPELPPRGSGCKFTAPIRSSASPPRSSAEPTPWASSPTTRRSLNGCVPCCSNRTTGGAWTAGTCSVKDCRASPWRPPFSRLLYSAERHASHPSRDHGLTPDAETRFKMLRVLKTRGSTGPQLTPKACCKKMAFQALLPARFTGKGT
jgi:hypothetical protein